MLQHDFIPFLRPQRMSQSAAWRRAGAVAAMAPPLKTAAGGEVRGVAGG